MNLRRSVPDSGSLLQCGILLACGTIVGLFAWSLSMPLPFMLGGLASTMIIVSVANTRSRKLYFPAILRKLFIGLIGTMIGSTFSPEVMSVLPTFAITLSVLTVYVLVAHSIGYLICRQIGKYDPVTAFYSSMPGGLVEAVILGEKGGGNVQVLSLTHFLRLCVVVVTVPTVFYFYFGSAVGSAAGQSFETGPWSWIDVATVIAISLVGLVVGWVLHIPAGHLLGPMLLSAALYGSGVVSASNPTWLLFTAQLIVGVGLGTQLSGAKSATFSRILCTTLIMVTTYLLLSVLLALALVRFTGLSAEALFLSLAPGGVTEMGLIALSLSLSPVVVSAHHVFRIFLTVLIAAVSTRWFNRNQT